MTERNGWLLDLYEDALDGLVLWWLDDSGARLRLRQDFPVAFCAGGPEPRLRALETWLAGQTVRCAWVERRDVFADREVRVLEVQTHRPAQLLPLFRRVERAFRDLEYADVDVPVWLRYAARWGAFPLARCSVEVDHAGKVRGLSTGDSPWLAERPALPLRVMELEPDCDPAHDTPRALQVRCGAQACTLSWDAPRALLSNLRALLERCDPDLILAARGDTWLLPRLLDLSAAHGVPIPFNRDPHAAIQRRKERWYFSYGQLVYRGEQVTLAGRWHIDRHNAMLWDDYDLEGVLELARVTGLPLQTAARVSPGTGISAVQMLTALRLGVLVPWQKQQAEQFRPALDLFTADQGGLVYQPPVGLHREVVGLDFVSMYPAIMVNYNLSPETVGPQRPGAEQVPELGLWVDRSRPGLIPQALAGLLARRVALKERLASLRPDDPRRKIDQKRASALKWLLVTCFGYLGYKNARFGRIEAHQAVTAYGREALLCAKEAAEDLGYEVLQMYVDGLWVRRVRPDAAETGEVLAEIFQRTGLPIGIDGIYRWVVFLPSRVHTARSAANRYYGLFEDGTLKLRGIEARRRDTPPFIARVQREALEELVRHEDPDIGLAAAGALLRRHLSDLRSGRVAPEDLLLSQKMGRELEDYRARSPVARAVLQLKAAGRPLKPGQRVRYLLTLGAPGVRAWDLPEPFDRRTLNLSRYTELVIRAVEDVLAPFRPPAPPPPLLPVRVTFRLPAHPKRKLDEWERQDERHIEWVGKGGGMGRGL